MKNLLDAIMIEEVADTLHPTGMDLDANASNVMDLNKPGQPNFVVNVGVPGELDRARKVMGLKNNGISVSRKVTISMCKNHHKIDLIIFFFKGSLVQPRPQ